MLSRKLSLLLALVAMLAVAIPATAQAGGDAPPLTPSIVGVPLARADKALNNAADSIDSGNGAAAIAPLQASRRYMIRAYRGAKYLIANTPAAPVEEASAAKYQRFARKAIRSARRGNYRSTRFLLARASQDDATGPVFADTPTAVFSVFTGQYNAVTAAVGMLPDVQGGLLTRVQTTLNTALVLRNRLVTIVHNAAPAVPPEEARAAQEADDVATFDLVMPGVAALIGDEVQQMQGIQTDTTVPAASRAALAIPSAANQQILTKVNTWWPPVPAED
jgi:hypothetical protein